MHNFVVRCFGLLCWELLAGFRLGLLILGFRFIAFTLQTCFAPVFQLAEFCISDVFIVWFGLPGSCFMEDMSLVLFFVILWLVLHLPWQDLKFEQLCSRTVKSRALQADAGSVGEQKRGKHLVVATCQD